MVELTLKNNPKKIYFNLKDYHREKSFRDAWYSMSDITSCKDKKLKIVTDRKKSFIYKIHEIEKVLFIDREYLYEEDPSNNTEDPLLEKTINQNDNVFCNNYSSDCIIHSNMLNRPSNTFSSNEYALLFSSSPNLPLICGLSSPSSVKMPPCLEALKDGRVKFKELPTCAKNNIEKMKNLLSKIYNKFPEDTKKKLNVFYTELLKQKVNIDFQDPNLKETIFDMLADTKENSAKYAQEYIEKKRNKDNFE